MTVIRELLLTRPDERPRRFVDAMLIVAAVAALALGADRRLINPSIQPAPDSHAWVSLNHAINAVFCGKPGYLSSRFEPAQFLGRRPDLDRLSLREVVASQTGSMGAYCATVTEPVPNNENSLMLVMAGVLRVWPGVSFHGLGVALAGIRLVCWSAFAAVLCWSGASLLLTAWTFYVGAVLLRWAGMELSVYSFLLVLPPLMTSAYVVAFSLRRLGLRSQALAALGVGALTAVAANGRTSYVAIWVAFFVVWVFLVTRDDRARAVARRRSVGVAVLVATGSLAYLVVDRAVVWTSLPTSSTASIRGAYHPLAHPLVLGVALPENDFARRLGITWDDAVGLDLARRANPRVSYLGPGYERALLQYYWYLWRTYPADMRRLYWFKLQRTAHGLFEAMSNTRLVPHLGLDRARHLDRLSRGSVLLGLAMVATAATFWVTVRRASRLMLAGGLLSVAACALIVESAVIAPTFTPQYHTYLLFYFLFLPAFAVQVAIDAIDASFTGRRS